VVLFDVERTAQVTKNILLSGVLCAPWVKVYGGSVTTDVNINNMAAPDWDNIERYGLSRREPFPNFSISVSETCNFI